MGKELDIFGRRWKRTGHLWEKISLALWRESKSSGLNSRQRKIDPSIKGSSSVMELSTKKGADKTIVTSPQI